MGANAQNGHFTAESAGRSAASRAQDSREDARAARWQRGAKELAPRADLRGSEAMTTRARKGEFPAEWTARSAASHARARTGGARAWRRQRGAKEQAPRAAFLREGGHDHPRP